MTRRPDIPPLTSLRIFAAFLVVIFHYNIGGRIPSLGVISGFGYEAVTFFFVLSGFILTYVHVDDGKLNIGTSDFMMHRISRIGPAYFLGLLLAAPFFVAALKHGQVSVAQFVAALVFIPSAMQAWLPSLAILWNIPAWSLSVELFLYATFVPLIRASRLDRGGFLAAAYAMVCLFGLTKALVAGNKPPSIDPEWWHNFVAYFPLWHFPQFIFGIALGRLFVDGGRLSEAWHGRLLWVSIFMTATALWWHATFPILSNSTILAPIFGAMIFAAAGANGLLTRLLSVRPLVLLGEASYATYIIHMPLWLWWDHIVRVAMKVELAPSVDFACYLIAVIAASLLTYFFLERPARRWILAAIKSAGSRTSPRFPSSRSADARSCEARGRHIDDV
jgi:peptidoglycan/LPS O-acetylase OafA/YrhL